MNSDQLFDCIEHIAATPGKKDKERLVGTLLEDELGLKVLTYAYDPFKTFGIQKTLVLGSGTEVFEPHHTYIFAFLDQLASRELSGHAARDALQAILAKLTTASGNLLLRIIKKDLRAGFTDGTINRVRPATLAEFPYMRCSLPKDAKLESWPWAKGCVSQVKADGMFANVNVYSDGTVSIHSRQGTPFPVDHADLDALRYDLSRLARGNQYHGELLVELKGAILPRQISNGMLNKVAQGGELEPGHRITYAVWDRIPIDVTRTPKGKFTQPYNERLMELIKMLREQSPGSAVSLIETRIVKSLSEAYKHSSECMARGLEGTIVKHRDAIWKDGTSKEQVKLKLECPVELEIRGFTPGNGKHAVTFGAIECASSDGKLWVNVGTGISDKLREELNAKRADLLGDVITVKANDLLGPSDSNPNWSLFLPVFVEIRTDKRDADDLERIQTQFDAAKGTALKVAA